MSEKARFAVAISKEKHAEIIIIKKKVKRKNDDAVIFPIVLVSLESFLEAGKSVMFVLELVK